MGLYVDDLATYLQTGSIGTLGTDLFRFSLVESPDKQFAIVPYGGMESETQFGSDDLKWEYPRAQFISRSDRNDPRPAAELSKEAEKLVGKIQAETLSGTFYHGATILKPSFLLGIDDSGRHMFAFNASFEKEVASSP